MVCEFCLFFPTGYFRSFHPITLIPTKRTRVWAWDCFPTSSVLCPQKPGFSSAAFQKKALVLQCRQEILIPEFKYEAERMVLILCSISPPHPYRKGWSCCCRAGAKCKKKHPHHFKSLACSTFTCVLPLSHQLPGLFTLSLSPCKKASEKRGLSCFSE